MKRMHLIIVAFVIGLALGGWLTLRHAMRTAVTALPVSDLPAPTASASKPMDGWQAELAALRDREGGATLWQHGLAAAARGLTTIEQVARVL